MNQLKVNIQENIVGLHERGWSKRRIARELGLDRATVRKYLAQTDSKSPTPHTGSGQGQDSKPATVHTGSEEVGEAKSPRVHTGSSKAGGQASLCEPLREEIEKGLTAGLSMQRIYQDLVREHQFEGSYYAVRRFVMRHQRVVELPYRRMETDPGQELQIDFGEGGWVVENGKRRRPYYFRGILSHSRKGYSEVVWHQTAESFIRCLENAFRHFGGATATVVIDNLKAGVIKADWFDPDLNPKLDEFARHYGTMILPTKPKMPWHKGKVESGVKYGQSNAVKGRKFESLAEQNRFLADWERTIADTRIHGTTRKQVASLFELVERAALKPLPVSVFPVFVEARRTVHRDGYVEFKRAYYSVPPEYVGRTVWVRVETRLLRVLNTRREQIALHVLAEPGKFTTDPGHIHSHKRSAIERGFEHLLDRCRLIGPACGSWAEGMHQVRGPLGMRVMLGLLQMADKHPVAELEKAAAIAIHHGSWRLRDLKRLLDQPANVVQLDFLQTHDLIRPLEAYRIEGVETLKSEP